MSHLFKNGLEEENLKYLKYQRGNITLCLLHDRVFYVKLLYVTTGHSEKAIWLNFSNIKKRDAQLVLRGPKCAKQISPTPLHHHHQPEPLRQGRMDPCFNVLYAKFWPYHLNVAAEIETHQTRQRFSNLLLSNFGEPVWIVASVSCS